MDPFYPESSFDRREGFLPGGPLQLALQLGHQDIANFLGKQGLDTLDTAKDESAPNAE